MNPGATCRDPYRAMTPPLALALVALDLIVSACPSAAQDAPYAGRWAENPAWCRNNIYSGTDEMPVTITPGSIEFFAATCRILGVTATGRGVFRMRASCRDEGQTEHEPRERRTYTLRVAGDRLTLDDGISTGALMRCPK